MSLAVLVLMLIFIVYGHPVLAGILVLGYLAGRTGWSR